MKKKIAIIGGGIAGLTASYLLHNKYDITLFEKDDRLGGNAHTHNTKDGYEFDIAVAVFGKKSYPNFCKLLSELNISTTRIYKSFVSLHNLDTKKGLYITPHSLKALITQKFAMLNPLTLFSMAKIFPNINKGIRMKNNGELDGLSMEDALKRLPGLEGYAFLIPTFVLCIVSSMYFDEVMRAPASFFFGKMEHHKDFFSPRIIYAMNCATGRTRSYVGAIASCFKDKVILNSRITRITRSDKDVLLKMADGSTLGFDKVVFACNADQALNLLEKPTDKENTLLGPWAYKDGLIAVHRDSSSFPARELCQAFTFLYTQKGDKIHTSVNGSVWHEPGVPDDCPYISSQHPNFPIEDSLIDYKKIFRTPIFDNQSVSTITDLPTLNGEMNSYYCGSHFGYGLHEDAVVSAVEVAKMLGVEWS